MNKFPWLAKKKLELVNLILYSYESQFNQCLFLQSTTELSSKEMSASLFLFDQPVLAQDNRNDPLISYVNAAALQLWGRCWKDMIGMPSRLTAPKEEVTNRNLAFEQLKVNNKIKGYTGIRINKKGQLFSIQNAYIWNLIDAEGKLHGQAATFKQWSKLSKLEN